MKVIILEDELISRQKIEEFVLRYDSQIEIVLSTESFGDVTKYLVNQSVDLILADIQVFDGNVFERLSTQPIVCPFIFITAYDIYTFEALENYGIGYILKPYIFEQFSKAMDRFYRLNRKIVPDISQVLRAVKTKHYRERMIVKSKKGAKILKIEDVQFIEIDGGVIFIFNDNNERYMLSETTTLNSFEESLDPALFFRLNRSQIIHLDAIKSFEPYGKDRILIKIENLNSKLITSVKKTPSFRRWVNSWDK